MHSPLFCLHLPGGLQDPFYLGQVASLVHLWVPPHRGVTALRHHLHRRVLAACTSHLLPEGQAALMCGDGRPPAEPLYLQPKEQGHEVGPKEAAQQNSPFSVLRQNHYRGPAVYRTTVGCRGH